MVDHEKRQEYSEDPSETSQSDKATHDREKENLGMKETDAGMDFDDNNGMGEIEER